LGSPIGKEEFISSSLKVSLTKYPLFLPRLKLLHPHQANLLLRLCHHPIANHLLRTVHPSTMIPHASTFDDEIFTTYKVINKDPLIEPDNPLLRLPFRRGGMGLRSTAELSPIAYFSSVVGAVNTLAPYDSRSQDALSLIPSEEGEIEQTEEEKNTGQLVRDSPSHPRAERDTDPEDEDNEDSDIVHDDTDASDCSVSDEDDSDIPPDDPPSLPP